MSAPPWFEAARKEIGTKELPENRGPAIRRYIDLAHCGKEGDPWCAIFANAMLASVGIPGTRNAMARSFEHDGHFLKLAGPSLGRIRSELDALGDQVATGVCDIEGVRHFEKFLNGFNWAISGS
jgi:hypothetical protein